MRTNSEVHNFLRIRQHHLYSSHYVTIKSTVCGLTQKCTISAQSTSSARMDRSVHVFLCRLEPAATDPLLSSGSDTERLDDSGDKAGVANKAKVHPGRPLLSPTGSHAGAPRTQNLRARLPARHRRTTLGRNMQLPREQTDFHFIVGQCPVSDASSAG